MKKHFLLISLFALMFLGLGNYSLAVDNCSLEQNNYNDCMGLAGNDSQYIQSCSQSSALDSCESCISSCSLADWVAPNCDTSKCVTLTCTCSQDINGNMLVPPNCSSLSPSGSWSQNQSKCECKRTSGGNDVLPCTNTSTSSNASSTAVIDALKIACPTATITTQNFGSVNDLGDFKCCEENGDGSTKLDKCTQEQLDGNIPCTVQGSNLYAKPHSKNSIGDLSCTCNQGYTEIDSVCEPCDKEGVCCGVSLNTSVPFIGDCIEDKADDPSGVSSDQAFPVLMGSLVKILVTVILILSFVLIIIGGIMIATGNPAEGRKMIIKVVIGIALLGASGVILRLINPNFFG